MPLILTVFGLTISGSSYWPREEYNIHHLRLNFVLLTSVGGNDRLTIVSQPVVCMALFYSTHSKENVSRVRYRIWPQQLQYGLDCGMRSLLCGIFHYHGPAPPTSPAFGHPLQFSSFEWQIPSWVVLESFLGGTGSLFLLPQTRPMAEHNTQWRRYGPRIFFSEAEGTRLINYSRLLLKAEVKATGNHGFTPAPISHSDDMSCQSSSRPGSPLTGNDSTSSDGRSVCPIRGGHHSAGTLKGSQVDYGSDDAYDYDLDNQRINPIHFARAWALYSAHPATTVQDHERKVEETQNVGISHWVDSVQSGV